VENVVTSLDLVIFFASLLAVLSVGIIAGLKESTSEDYFLAGKNIPWWGVAGSIFGTNVSANHMVGMMGIGFSVGFAQSHFELGAILGLMVLCYGFLPVYRKLNLYTLSEYLERRYDERSRGAYAIIMVIIMAVVQMVPGLYIGARAACLLIGGDAVQQVPVAAPAVPRASTGAESDALPPADPTFKLHVNPTYYAAFVVSLAMIAAAYTIFGGLKAVVYTDVLQSALLLVAGIVLAVLTFRALGGWGELIALDSGPTGAHKMHLYLPTNHPELPWTGVFTGLMCMHCFYWGTNQFIVQRALGAKSGRAGRQGIVAAGYLKLLIPFFAIATGVAAFYLFRLRLPERAVAPDAAFPELVRLIVPIGYGLVGIIAAGLIGSIMSTVDSLMNSAATVVTIDLYQRYLRPKAGDHELIWFGRGSIAFFVVSASLMAIYWINPNSEKNFFLEISNYETYLTPGLLVAFALGMLWKRGTATAGFAAILSAVLFSWLVQFGYDTYVGADPKVYALATGEVRLEDARLDDLPAELKPLSMSQRRERLEQRRDELTRHVPLVGSRQNVINWLGLRLNFFHRVVGVLLLSSLVYVIVSYAGKADPAKSRMNWTDLGGHDPRALFELARYATLSLGVLSLLGFAMWQEWLVPVVAGIIGALWTLGVFLVHIARTWNRPLTDDSPQLTGGAKLAADDRLWAGVLCSLAVFMLYFFY
jgi:SSS family solute:Na+ symporter